MEIFPPTAAFFQHAIQYGLRAAGNVPLAHARCFGANIRNLKPPILLNTVKHTISRKNNARLFILNNYKAKVSIFLVYCFIFFHLFKVMCKFSSSPVNSCSLSFFSQRY